MKHISAVILATNEERTIGKALDSVTFADEVLVVDDHSTDTTKIIATKKKAKVLAYTGADDFSLRRNFALSNTKHDWVLFLDADEQLSDELRTEILQLPDNPAQSAFSVRRIDYFWNKRVSHGELHNARFDRLVHRGRGTFTQPVHEFWRTKGQVQPLHGELKHFPHKTIAEFLNKINHYSTLNAKFYFDNGRKINAFDIVVTPIAKFLYTYFIQLGFIDGVAGFVYSFMMSFHSFLTRAKLYLYLHAKNT